ncbi:hypothetical protein Ancab_038755 [Ancistrocladus abbreviatus]
MPLSPSLQSKNCNGLLLFDEDEQEPSASGSLSDLAEDSHGESKPLSRKRSRKHSFTDDNSDEDINKELDMPPRVELCKKPSTVLKESLNVGILESKSRMVLTSPKLQEAFQPGATPMQPGTRSFLRCNTLGSITTIQPNGYTHVEIDFHDTCQGPRVPPMTDYFCFTMASLNENGSILANPHKGEKHLSTLMYRPFKSWANNSKRHVISPEGSVVIAAGFKDELAIVTHTSRPLPCTN